MRTTMDPKTRKTKILMISCLSHTNFHLHKPPPNPPFQQHFCGKKHFFNHVNDICKYYIYSI